MTWDAKDIFDKMSLLYYNLLLSLFAVLVVLAVLAVLAVLTVLQEFLLHQLTAHYKISYTN